MAELTEIRIQDLDTQEFIKMKSEEISALVGSGLAINALSGRRRFFCSYHVRA